MPPHPYINHLLLSWAVFRMTCLAVKGPDIPQRWPRGSLGVIVTYSSSKDRHCIKAKDCTHYPGKGQYSLNMQLLLRDMRESGIVTYMTKNTFFVENISRLPSYQTYRRSLRLLKCVCRVTSSYIIENSSLVQIFVIFSSLFFKKQVLLP